MLRTYTPCFEHVAHCWWLSCEATWVGEQIWLSFLIQASNCYLCSHRILVGAPQAAGRGPLSGSRPGALFRCPITPEEYDCERVDIDGEGAEGAEMKNVSAAEIWGLLYSIIPFNAPKTEWFLNSVCCRATVSGCEDGIFLYINSFPYPSLFYLSESEQREQTQPVAGSYCQESGYRRESGGKTHKDVSPTYSEFGC